MADLPPVMCDTACWLAKADAHPWSERAADEVIQSIDVARALGDRLAERGAQRRLAADFRPQSAWALANEPLRVAAVELRIRTERSAWVPDAPLTTLADIGVTPVAGTWDELLPRYKDGERDVTLLLSLAELAPDTGRARRLYREAVATSDDRVVDAYAALHGEWDTREVAALATLRLGAEAPARLADDLLQVVGARRVGAGGPLTQAEPDPLLRAMVLAGQAGRGGTSYHAALRTLIAHDPTDTRVPMLRWELARATRERADMAALFRFSGPDSSWWSTADAGARAGVATLLERARTELRYVE